MKQTDIQYECPLQPRQLRIDSTTVCNARCLSCHRSLSKRHGEMPTELLLKVLDTASKLPQPLTEIIPVNYGEFMCRKDWLWILQQIAMKLPKTQIVLPTNGSLFDRESIEQLCSIHTLKIINFSVNAFFDETYEQFMGLPASNIKNIRKAINLIKLFRPDILIWISMVADPVYQTDREKELFKTYWQEWGLVWFLSASSAGRDGKSPCHPVKVPCRSIFSDLVVGYDGKLSSCCWDSRFSIDLGFLQDYGMDILKAWRNEKITRLRQLHNEHRRDEVELCKGCTSA